MAISLRRLPRPTGSGYVSGLTDPTIGGENGIWWGSGIRSLPVLDGFPSRIFTDDTVYDDQVTALFNDGLHPDAIEIAALLSAQRASENDTLQAVRIGMTYQEIASTRAPGDAGSAGFDAMFMPPKSVSMLWGLAETNISNMVRQCHDQAVHGTLAWIEDEFVYTREGPNGVRSSKTCGLIAALFTHWESGDGTPNLHTHCVVANKVKSVASGKWLPLDVQALHHAIDAISEHYNMLLETFMEERLGGEFETDATSPMPGVFGGRQTREIRGIDPQGMAHFTRPARYSRPQCLPTDTIR